MITWLFQNIFFIYASSVWSLKVIPLRQTLPLSSSSWKIDKIDGKGYGVIATRDIYVGECIMEDVPVIKMSTKPSWFVPTESRTLQRINDALNKVFREQRDSYLSLHAYSNSIINDDESKALAVFRTNAYPLHSYQKPDHNTAGVYLNISRLNSACIPNVHYSYDSTRECGTIYCIHPIPKNHEILNTYISLFLSKSDRLNYLYQSFGFRCDCKACQLQGNESELSDKRRQRLHELESLCQNRLDHFDSNTTVINSDNLRTNQSDDTFNTKPSNIDIITTSSSSLTTTAVKTTIPDSPLDSSARVGMDIELIQQERMKLLMDEGLSTPASLYRVFLDSFLLMNHMSMKQFIHRNNNDNDGDDDDGDDRHIRKDATTTTTITTTNNNNDDDDDDTHDNIAKNSSTPIQQSSPPSAINKNNQKKNKKMRKRMISAESMEWLRKAKEYAVLCTGFSSTQVTVCQYYLDQFRNDDDDDDDDDSNNHNNDYSINHSSNKDNNHSNNNNDNNKDSTNQFGNNNRSR